MYLIKWMNFSRISKLPASIVKILETAENFRTIFYSNVPEISVWMFYQKISFVVWDDLNPNNRIECMLVPDSILFPVTVQRTKIVAHRFLWRKVKSRLSSLYLFFSFFFKFIQTSNMAEPCFRFRTKHLKCGVAKCLNSINSDVLWTMSSKMFFEFARQVHAKSLVWNNVRLIYVGFQMFPLHLKHVIHECACFSSEKVFAHPQFILKRILL